MAVARMSSESRACVTRNGLFLNKAADATATGGLLNQAASGMAPHVWWRPKSVVAIKSRVPTKSRMPIRLAPDGHPALQRNLFQKHDLRQRAEPRAHLARL